MRVKRGGWLIALARELGYRDGSGVLRAVQRLDASAAHDHTLRQRLEALRKELEDVNGKR